MDFIADQSGRHLLRLSELWPDEPAYVKNCSLAEEDIKKLTRHQFADSARREFPIHTPGHTFLSYAYCKSAGISNPNLLQSILKAGDLHRIEADLKKLDDIFNSQTKLASAAASPRFAVTIDFGDPDPTADEPCAKSGGLHNFYPIHDAFQIEESARKLASDRNRIPPELFFDGCRELVKAAAAHRVDPRTLPTSVLIMGEERLPDLDYVKMAAAKRSVQTGDPIYQEIALTLAEDTDPNLDQYAGLWKQADAQNNLTYGKAVEDPWSILHSGKSASAHRRELDAWALINETPVPVSAVRSLPEADIRKFFAQGDADALVSLTKSAASLEGPDITNAVAALDPKLAKRYLAVLAR